MNLLIMINLDMGHNNWIIFSSDSLEHEVNNMKNYCQM